MQQLSKRLEVIRDHIKSFNHKTNSTNNLVRKIRHDLIQRYELRNNYYHRNLPLLLHDLCFIKSRKKYFQLKEKQHYQSIQFYKKVFNIQSSSTIEQLQQSIQYLHEIKNDVHQYENDIKRLQQELIQQNNQINLYSNNLFQIQFEQNLIQSDIKQLKQKIRFEKQFYHEQKLVLDSKLTFKIDENILQETYQTLTNQETTLNNYLQTIKNLNQHQLDQFHTEYTHLSTQITQINFDIEQKSIDLLPLQSELQAYRTILNMNESNLTVSKGRPLLIPTINRQSTSLINKFNTNIVRPEQQLLPLESITTTEWTKCKSKKSKAIHDVCF